MSTIPVTIVTGFLGAGKTTLVNALLRQPDFAETAILINEFGDAQIDHDLVANFSDELILTTTGCICCTASSDIKQSLADLWQRRDTMKAGPFRRVIVETTGLMDPVPVVNSLLSPPTIGELDRIITQEFALSRVVTLFDVIHGARQLDEYPEALKQIGLADIIVLTKTDMSRDPATLRDIQSDRKRLLAINPGCSIFDRHTDWAQLRGRLLENGTYDLRDKGDDALAWLKDGQVLSENDHSSRAHTSHDHSVHVDKLDRTHHGDDIRSHVIVLDQPISRLVLFMFLETLKMNAGTNLLRLKGLIAVRDDPDRPIVVHGVQHLIHPIDQLDRWPSDDKRTRIVLIGRHLDVEALELVLEDA